MVPLCLILSIFLGIGPFWELFFWGGMVLFGYWSFWELVLFVRFLSVRWFSSGSTGQDLRSFDWLWEQSSTLSVPTLHLPISSLAQCPNKHILLIHISLVMFLHFPISSLAQYPNIHILLILISLIIVFAFPNIITCIMPAYTSFSFTSALSFSERSNVTQQIFTFLVCHQARFFLGKIRQISLCLTRPPYPAGFFAFPEIVRRGGPWVETFWKTHCPAPNGGTQVAGWRGSMPLGCLLKFQGDLEVRSEVS